MEISLHPIIVHYAIALFPCSVLFDCIGYLSGRQKFHFASWLNLIAAAVSILLAIASGLLAKSQIVAHPFIRPALETHETMMFISSILILGLFLWRMSNKGKFPERWRKTYLALSLIGLTILTIGGYHGGKIVHVDTSGIRLNIQSSSSFLDHSLPAVRDSIDKYFYPPTE